MAFIGERNARLDDRFKDIATFYKRFGEQWHVRWDYAVYQMILETNYLSYRQGNGRRGDVWEDQNNFAGIGATGRGARGERFPDVATGVHAQIQHLVAYSGEKIDDPVARRTRENQDEIIEKSQRLKRTVTFADLTRRWATDRAYAKSIEFVADLYRTRYCTGKEEEAADATAAKAQSKIKPTVAAGPAPELTPVSSFSPVADPTKLHFRPPSGLGGPKPDMLGSPADEAPTDEPEVLPWLKNKQNAGAEKEQPEAPIVKHKRSAPATKPSAPRTSEGSARTIWRRGDGGTNNSTSKAQPAAPQAPQNAAPAPDAAPVNSFEPSVGAEAPATPMLPTFHIAPVAEAPSRLGGPLPSPLPAAADEPIGRCHILAASYGGTKTLLLRTAIAGETNLTALTVLDGFEKSMVNTYAKAVGADAEVVGEYPNKDVALAEARSNCPNG